MGFSNTRARARGKVDSRKIDLRARCGAFGLPMSRVSEADLDGIARQLFGILDREPDAEAAIARMTKKQRSWAARANAPAIVRRLQFDRRPAVVDDGLDEDERLILIKCRATAKRLEPGEARDNVVAFIAQVFGEKAVARL